MSDELLVSRHGAVQVLSLNRPDKLNAYNLALSHALVAALAEAKADPSCRAVLLKGEGRGFCSGQDLSEVPESTDLGHLLEQRYVPVVTALRRLPKPVVCAVHGVAAGAGANLALACDIVLAGQSAKFIQAFVRIALIPDVGGTWFLPRLVGAARARGLAMLGEAVDAVEAERWGMIWRAVPDETLMDEALQTATRLAALPTATLGLIKRALDASETNSFEQQLAVEAECQREAGYSADFKEGVAAFLEKRAPHFGGQAA